MSSKTHAELLMKDATRETTLLERIHAYFLRKETASTSEICGCYDVDHRKNILGKKLFYRCVVILNLYLLPVSHFIINVK
jgi:hypothetical protein